MKTIILTAVLVFFLAPSAAYTVSSAGGDITLRTYIEKILEERDKRNKTRFDASKEALILSQSTLDSRFVRLEKFIQDTSIFNDRINRLNDKINVMSERITKIETIATSNAESARNWVLGIGLFFTFVQIALQFVYRKQHK